jgi:hypothetical protein
MIRAGSCSERTGPGASLAQSLESLEPRWSLGACGARAGLPVSRMVTEGERRDSNPRPPGPQPGALPAELRPPRIKQSRASPSRRKASRPRVRHLPELFLQMFRSWCRRVPPAPNAPGRIRTCDPRLRRPPLCPTELRGLGVSLWLRGAASAFNFQAGKNAPLSAVERAEQRAPRKALTGSVAGPFKI